MPPCATQSHCHTRAHCSDDDGPVESAPEATDEATAATSDSADVADVAESGQVEPAAAVDAAVPAAAPVAAAPEPSPVPAAAAVEEPSEPVMAASEEQFPSEEPQPWRRGGSAGRLGAGSRARPKRPRRGKKLWPGRGRGRGRGAPQAPPHLHSRHAAHSRPRVLLCSPLSCLCMFM